MFKVYIEYKVKSNASSKFISLLPEIKSTLEFRWGVKQYEVYKATEQEGIYVEEFLINNLNNLKEIREVRESNEENLWIELSSCIVGGREKVNMWSFQREL